MSEPRFCWGCVAPAVEEATATGQVVRLPGSCSIDRPAMVVPEPHAEVASALPGYPVRNAADDASAYVVTGGDGP